MRRVLLVHPFAQPISGPDESILGVIAELAPRGWRYDAVLPGQSPFRPRYEALGCRVFEYPMSVIKRSLNPLFVARYAWRFWPTVRFLSRLIRDTGAHLVHTNGAVVLGGPLAARRMGRPSVVHVRCTAIARPAAVASGVVRMLGRTSARIVAISGACAQPFAGRGLGSRVTVIPNGVDLERFARAAADRDLWRRAYGLAPGAPVVGQVCRIGADKGVREFVDLAAQVREAVPEAHFVVVGAPHLAREHAYLGEVQDRAARLGLGDRVHFAGRREDIPAVMAGLDVLVALSREEGLGRTAIEAMAAGRPVVANNVHGLREVVSHGETGFLAGPRDTRDAAGRVVALLKDAELRARLGRAGRARAEARFSAATCAQAVERVYEEVLDEHARRADRASG